MTVLEPLAKPGPEQWDDLARTSAAALRVYHCIQLVSILLTLGHVTALAPPSNLLHPFLFDEVPFLDLVPLDRGPPYRHKTDGCKIRLRSQHANEFQA